MKRDSAPCKDCEDRYLGCHSKCDRYQQFRKEKDEQNRDNMEKFEKSYQMAKYIRSRYR